jgi:diketogulonate reductase-like aldo/keto reductase
MWRQQQQQLVLFLATMFIGNGRSMMLVASAVATEDERHQDSTRALLPGTISLRDGAAMPRVGLGVALTAEHTYEAVTHAIAQVGYTLVDTAAEESYGNEDQVGRALNDYYRSYSNNNTAAVEDAETSTRSRIFVTTKLWDSDHGFYRTLRAFRKSYRELNTFVTTDNVSENENENENDNKNNSIPIDLYLVHSPFGGRLIETWDALLWLQNHQSDKVVSIGVSNFGIDHLEVLRRSGRPMPVVNQIEMHPLVFSQRQRSRLLDYCHEHNIQIQAFGSLLHGYPRFLTNPPPLLSDMVERYNTNGVDYAVYHSMDDESKKEKDGKKKNESSSAITVVHILLQWALQHGFAIIPKSSKTQRITENVRYLNLGNEKSNTNNNNNKKKNSNKNKNRLDFFLSKDDMELLDQWGNHIPYEHRNVYKKDWNWNPIDEAPVHSGNEDYWPGYEDLEHETNLERILDVVADEDNEDEEEEYWKEYWRNGIHLDEDDYDDEDDDEHYYDEDEEEFHEEL